MNIANRNNDTDDFLSFSVVSHGQAKLVKSLLDDLNNLSLTKIEVILTINIQEDERKYGDIESYNFPIKIIRNRIPKGFGANHNAALLTAVGNYHCIINPDIRITSINLQEILSIFKKDNVGAVAPMIISENGVIQDSCRKFPTFLGLIKRKINRKKIKLDYIWSEHPIEVDWIAGMFIIFRPNAFSQVCGFDEKKYFMYFEDVDICNRLHDSGWKIIFDPRTKVIHNAQRDSHRKIKYLLWHMQSAFRYLTNK